MSGPRVEVTDAEFEACRRYVKGVQTRSDQRGFNHASTMQRTPERRAFEDINRHCGEIALCRFLGVEWLPDINAFHVIPDVGNVFEVRTTHYPRGALIVRDNDPLDDGRCFVLVTGNAWQPPRAMTLRGCLWAPEICEVGPQHLDNPGGHRRSMFIPQTKLQPFTLDVFAPAY